MGTIYEFKKALFWIGTLKTISPKKLISENKLLVITTLLALFSLITFRVLISSFKNLGNANKISNSSFFILDIVSYNPNPPSIIHSLL